MTEIDRHIGARRALYRLLARLYLAPPDAELAAELRALPGFAGYVPTETNQHAWLDELAVEFERLFGRNIYPYESIFRDRELMLNTAAADAVASMYREYEAAGDAQAGAPDHLGAELAFMAELLMREGQASACGDARAVQHARSGQLRCLREHLADWAPICALTLARITTHPIYATLAALTAELVLSDAAALPSGVGRDAKSTIPLSAHDNAAEERGLGQVVRRLLTPVDAGLLITREDLSAIGRAIGLPVPIGDREQMLRSLFETAGQFEQVSIMLDALHQLFDKADLPLAALIHEHPAWEAQGREWRERIGASKRLLEELRIQASELDRSG